MKFILRIIEAKDFTIGDGRRVKYALEKAGFEVEMQPTEIRPVQYKITKGGDLPVIMPDDKPSPSSPPREHPDGTTD